MRTSSHNIYSRSFNHFVTVLSFLIIRITISSILIGLKNSYFPLIHLPSCHRTVQLANHIQSCSLIKSTNHNLGFNHHRNSVQTLNLGLSFFLSFFATLNNLRLLCQSFNAIFPLSFITWLFFSCKL